MKDHLKSLSGIKDDNHYQYANYSNQYLNKMHEYLYHEIDFGIFWPESVMQFAENLGPKIAGIENPSLVKQLKAAHDFEKKQHSYHRYSTQLC